MTSPQDAHLLKTISEIHAVLDRTAGAVNQDTMRSVMAMAARAARGDADKFDTIIRTAQRERVTRDAQLRFNAAKSGMKL